MTTLQDLFDNNRRWAGAMEARDPGFFRRLEIQQAPQYLWIGCSDSRVPANDIVGLMPGELFVHRNVANIVVHTDLNCLSVIQYAVEVLRVRHVIVCGHYGCGGVEAAFERRKLGTIDNWLRQVQEVHARHAAALDRLGSKQERLRRLSELNVIEQARRVCETTVVQEAWSRGQSLSVHGWIYAVSDGHLRDLGFESACAEQTAAAYLSSVAPARPPAK
ncbi:MAG: carbonic anhydrase [Acidobacteria bacterium RIFCSPLOWO2_02_FULL_67_36]|nr:MAG: carbonic anhydrase [Acidobacteria bacterium RIFCSPLOWO2_02_FULL_67_36]OFW19123.1 MAG: carbonic anhydrase [Acidobacteria bacterium RIFCSPLOWO2_12_FULL_66_21]